MTAIDVLTAAGTKLILNEVFDVDNLQELVQRGDAFFGLLPAPEAKAPLAPHSPYETEGENSAAGVTV